MEQESTTQTQYAYFDRSYKVELALFMIFGPALLTLWAATGGIYYYTEHISLPFLKASLYFTVAMIFALILYGNTRAIRRTGAVVVGREQIVKKSASGVRVLNCADINGVRRSGFPFLRWMVLESPKKSLRVPLYVRDGHEMVEKVFAILEERGLFFEGAASLKASLRGASMRFNIEHALHAGHLPNLVRAATAAAIFNGGVAALYWERGLIPAILWGIMNMLFQAIAHFATERLHVEKLLSGKDDGTFAGNYALAGVAALIFGMAVGILATNPV